MSANNRIETHPTSTARVCLAASLAALLLVGTLAGTAEARQKIGVEACGGAAACGGTYTEDHSRHYTVTQSADTSVDGDICSRNLVWVNVVVGNNDQCRSGDVNQTGRVPKPDPGLIALAAPLAAA